MVSRSPATVRSVASESSAPGMVTPCRSPAFSRAATSRSTSAIVSLPGSCASAAASRSARANTASRSERWAIAQATASAAGEGGGLSAPASRAGPFRVTLEDPRPPSGCGSRAAVPGRISAPAPLSIASAASAFASKPRPAAWRCHTWRSSSRSMSRLPARVISAARSAMPGLSAVAPRPRSAIAVSISARRVEKASTTARGTPAISNRPSGCVFSMVYPSLASEAASALR